MNYKLLALYLVVLCASVFVLTGCTGDGDEDNGINDTLVSIGDDGVDRSQGQDEVAAPSFSTESQELGEKGNNEYRIIDVSESGMGDFHRVSFEVDSEDNFVRGLPYVTADYRQDLDAIRLTFHMISEDDSGLDYQESLDINQDGVVRIYHNVSPEPQRSVYDVGVSEITEFKLHGEELPEGGWDIMLDVRYIEEEIVEEIEDQEDVQESVDESPGEGKVLEGATSSDGARVTAYSYGLDGGVFKFIWTVRGSDAKPTPKVQARTNADDDIIVVFPDLESDYIARDSNDFEVGRLVERISWSRTGNESMYKFDLDGAKDFNLKSSTSPNQIILEIELY